jgi:ABC-type nitrate/sulfonate/bicarbonate transport system permease component
MTLLRIVSGFCLGSGLGLFVALLGGLTRVVRDLLEPLIQVLKPIPAIAMAPFAILWFGLGFRGILFLVAWGCFFITVIDASEAIKNVPKNYVWAASALGASRAGVYFRVVLPSILPHILGGLRVSMVIAFNQTILGEFNSASGGLGQTIIQGYVFGQTDILFLGIIMIVLLAVIVDQLLMQIGQRATKWAT